MTFQNLVHDLDL